MRRKLTTIVAADMVGYTRLLNEDEQAVLGALECLRSHFLAPKAEAFGGRMFRFLGDGTLLEFESALGAVQFAIELQQALEDRNRDNPSRLPLVLRIGISLGDIVISDDDMHGDGVNVAVRIEALAEPTGFCLCDSVYGQVKNKVPGEFVSIGQRRLKSIADAVQVWRWRPAPEFAVPDYAERPHRPSIPVGHQVLDPRNVDILLQLHIRSGLLALSNALDATLDAEGSSPPYNQFYYHLGEQLHQARQALSPVKVVPVDNHQELLGPGGEHLSMGEFMASAFNDADGGFALRIIPRAQAILRGEDNVIVKRKRLLELIRRFQNEEFRPRVQAMIAYAYLE